jgi:hypothetical protein
MKIGVHMTGHQQGESHPLHQHIMFISDVVMVLS